MRAYLPESGRIQPMTLHERVTEQLIDWIMDGKLTMGQKLVTEEIAQQLGVSRMPVREALKNMEKMGLVESVPYAGARLVVLNMDDIKQIYIMRQALEPIAGYYACLNATEEDIRTVADIHEHFVGTVQYGKPSAKEIFVLNREFHFAIYRASGFQMICDTVSMLWSNLAFCKLIYGQTYVESKDSSLSMLAEHQEYLDMLRTRDADRMRKTLQENLQRVKRQIPLKLARYLDSSEDEILPAVND